MNCEKCGAEIQPEQNFCPSCGSELNLSEMTVSHKSVGILKNRRTAIIAICTLAIICIIIKYWYTNSLANTKAASGQPTVTSQQSPKALQGGVAIPEPTPSGTASSPNSTEKYSVTTTNGSNEKTSVSSDSAENGNSESFNSSKQEMENEIKDLEAKIKDAEQRIEQYKTEAENSQNADEKLKAIWNEKQAEFDKKEAELDKKITENKINNSNP